MSAGMSTDPTGAVLAHPAAPAEVAARHFAHRLGVETDPSDVLGDLAAGVGGFVVVDVRSTAAFVAGHVPGAVHCPHAEIPTRAAEVVPAGVTAVVYCWGPGCNGATKAGLAFARLGVGVKEMIGGFEWWARDGLPVERADGVTSGPADPLTAA
jgi:rhodanese-related sulfurtransferase